MNDDEVWSQDREAEPPVQDFMANRRSVVESAVKSTAGDGIHRVAANPVEFDGKS